MKINKVSISLLIFFVTALMLSVALARLILLWGNIQFVGMDGGVLVNAAWQLLLGYRPYDEVVTGAPPIFLLGSKIAFAIWGVHWSSLVYFTAVFAVLSFLLQVLIFSRLGLGKVWSLLLPFTVQSMTVLPIGWWWYNQSTAVIGILFFTTALWVYKQPISILSRLVFVMATTLLVLSKPNVAGVLLALILLIFLSVQKLRKTTISLFGSAAVVTLLVLFASGINPVSMVSSYQNSGGRVLSVSNLIHCLFLNDLLEASLTYIFLFPALAALLGTVIACIERNVLWREIDAPWIMIASTGVVGGVIGLCTNNEHNMVDASSILIGVTILTFYLKDYLVTSVGRNVVVTLILTSMLLLSVNGWWVGWQRHRVQSGGQGTFFEKATLTRLESPLLFQGVSVGPRLVRVIDQMETVLNQNHFVGQPSAPVFFGPRIDFGYAAYGILPPRGLPLWWEAFSKDEKNQTEFMVKRFKEARFRLCLFLSANWMGGKGADYTFLPPSLIEFLRQGYDVYELGDVTVHVLRTK